MIQQLKNTGVVFAALATASCARPPDSTEPLVLTWDSAGVEVTENSEAVLASVPILVVDSSAVRIGSVEGPESTQLFQVRGVRTLSDGSILVLNAGTVELRRYDPSGRFVSAFGRKGSGPGEMQLPVLMESLTFDTTWVLDITLRRFHVVDPAGSIVRSVPLANWLSGFSGLMDDSTALVAVPRFPRQSYDQVVPADVTVGFVDYTTGATDTLMSLETGGINYQYTVGELVRTVDVPFASFPLVRAKGGRAYVWDGSASRVRAYGRSGNLEREIRLNVRPEEVTDAAWTRAVEARLAEKEANQAGEGRLASGELDRQRRIYAEMERPSHMPAFVGLIADHDHLWVRRGRSGGDQEWIGLDKEGRVVAIAVVPASILVREISPEHVLGIIKDDLGVEFVVRYVLKPMDKVGNGGEPTPN